MTGRRHRPRPGLQAVVVCTDRGRHKMIRRRSLTLLRHSDGWVIQWLQREGPPPVTGYRDENGWQKFQFDCPACPRRPKVSEPDLAEVVVKLAGLQQVTGTNPVICDLWVLESR
jgi:hypothetical protein